MIAASMSTLSSSAECKRVLRRSDSTLNVDMHVNAATSTLCFRSVWLASLSQLAIRLSNCLAYLRATLLASDKNLSSESMSGRAVVRDKIRVARHTRRLKVTLFC